MWIAQRRLICLLKGVRRSMGKGGYLGGSTIVGGFGWSSYDPASGGIAKGKRKSNQQPPRTAKAKSKAKQAPVSTPKQKKAQKEKHHPNFNLLRLTYLEAIIDAALRARSAPVPPKKAREQLNAATLKAGGPVE